MYSRLIWVIIDEVQGIPDFLYSSIREKVYPMAKAYLLYGGSRRRNEGPVELLPLHDALPRLPEWIEVMGAD